MARIVDIFVEELDPPGLGFERCTPAQIRRPDYYSSVKPKLFIYGYLNRIPSSCRLKREAGNIELMWLTSRLVPNHKAVADFWRDNRAAIRRA